MLRIVSAKRTVQVGRFAVAFLPRVRQKLPNKAGGPTEYSKTESVTYWLLIVNY